MWGVCWGFQLEVGSLGRSGARVSGPRGFGLEDLGSSFSGLIDLEGRKRALGPKRPLGPEDRGLLSQQQELKPKTPSRHEHDRALVEKEPRQGGSRARAEDREREGSEIPRSTNRSSRGANCYWCRARKNGRTGKTASSQWGGFRGGSKTRLDPLDPRQARRGSILLVLAPFPPFSPPSLRSFFFLCLFLLTTYFCFSFINLLLPSKEKGHGRRELEEGKVSK